MSGSSLKLQWSQCPVWFTVSGHRRCYPQKENWALHLEKGESENLIMFLPHHNPVLFATHGLVVLRFVFTLLMKTHGLKRFDTVNDWSPLLKFRHLPYSLKFSRIKYFAVRLNSAQKQILWIKLSCSSASYVKPHPPKGIVHAYICKYWIFCGINFHGQCTTHENHKMFSYTVFISYENV